MIPTSISGLIGRTPLLEVPLRATTARLFLKLEKFNPGQSMKDRMALSMVEDAERSGRLKPGGTIIESSSGNTATGVAMIAAERGYRFIAVVDHHASPEKLRAIRAYGAETRTVEGVHDEGRVATKARETLARVLERTLPGSVYLNQPDNPANPDGYRTTMAQELLAELGALDLLVGAVGTGGSLSGTARALRDLGRGVYVIGVEPVGSIIFGGVGAPYYQSGTGTPEGVEIARNVSFDVIDEGVNVGDAEAFTTARFLARERGILIGGAAGGVVYAALEAIELRRTDVTVALVGDGGEKYLDTVFDDEWLIARGLLSTQVIDSLRARLLRRGESQ